MKERRQRVDFRPLVAMALRISDHINIALSPRKCLGGNPTKGSTDLGPYTVEIGRKKETLSNAEVHPACVSPELIAIAQKGPEGSGCRRICGLCNHGVWATTGSSGNAVTDSGWMMADTI